MVRCRVISCLSDSEKKIAGVSFHAFPDNPELRNTWIEATGRKDWNPTKYCKICSNHFPEKLLIKKNKKTVLYPDAVPTAISIPEECVDPAPSTSTSANFQDDTKIKSPKKVIKRKLQLPEEEDTPRKKKLKVALKKKTEAVASLRKKIRAVRQTNRRLMKRNAKLSDIISELQFKSLISYLYSYDHSPLDDHKVLLIKAITMKYLQIRIYKYTKQLSEPKEKVRNMYTKLTLFRNQ